MRCKKALSAILSFVMVVTMLTSVMVLPVAAATENGVVPFGSPAITVNVGDTVDLTKYGVEFTQGQVTENGLSWWNSSALNIVSYKKPAILANVGDTVTLSDWNVEFASGVVTDASAISWQKKMHPNTVTFGTPAILTDAGTKLHFADYPVEMTKGNVVSGDKLTWKQVTPVEVPLVTFMSPAIPANVGETVDLTQYAVEFANDAATMPSAITWKNGDTAVTAFTPAAKGTTALTATANGVSKTIYVVAKNANESKYVLYRNDFSSAADVSEMHKSTMGTAAATATYAEGGYLAHNRNGAATATNQSMLFAPAWLGDFGAYQLETSVAISAYGNNKRYFSFLTHGANTAKSGPYYVIGHTVAGLWCCYKNASASSWGLTTYSASQNNSAFTAPTLNAYYTYALTIDGLDVTSYFEGAQIGKYTMPDETPIVTGRPGFGFHGIDGTADYFEVSLLADSLETTQCADVVANYTPATKGVTAFEVTDGETTKTVYVVAKNAEDTEYVLYENDFNEAADLNDLTLVQKGAGTESVANGKFNFTRTSSTSASNRAYLLPEWLYDFVDYTLEMSASVNAQANTGRYIGFIFRAQKGTDGRPYGIAALDRKKQLIIGDRSTSEGTGWNPNWWKDDYVTNAYTLPAYNEFATYKMAVAGDNLKVWYNDSLVKDMTMPDTAPTQGRPGIMTAGIDFDIDNFKVTITAPEKITTADTFTPTAAGVTEFIATVNGVSKSVYVVAKEAADTEYVLYENNFDSAADLNDLQYLVGNTTANYPMTVANGVMSITRVNSANGNTTISFPAWLAEFGDYTIESSIAITAQQNTSRYFGLVFRGNPNGTYAPYYTSLYFRNGKWQGQRRVSTTNADWNTCWDSWAGPSKDGAFTAPALNTFATYKVAVAGDTATAYYNGAQVGTYTPTDVRDTGFVGLFITAMDAQMDYFKVTLAEEKTVNEEITTFTPEVAGVTPLTVKDAEGNEKTVYVVAKKATDTDYVLFETDFNNPSDVNAVTLVEGNATLTVENGALNVAASNAYMRLPEWLGDFGDYKMEMVATTTDYTASSEWLGLFARGQQVDSAKDAYIARVRHVSSAWDAAGYYYRDANGTLNRYSWGGHTTVSKGSTHTYTLLAKEDLLTFNQDSDYVFYAEEEKVSRVGYLGFALSNVTLSVDSIRVTVEDIQKPNAPVAATFTPEAGLAYGTIAGSLQVSLDTAGDQAVDVVYYWGDGNGKLANYAAFDKVLVKGKLMVVDTIPVGTVVPVGATELRVYTANEAGESDTCVVVPLPISVRNMVTGEEKMSFQMASDSHTMSSGSYNDVKNDAHLIDLLQDIAVFDPDSVGLFHGGDIVDNGKIAEYEAFREIWNTYSNGLALEGIIGNHEYWSTAAQASTVENFVTYTGIAITPEKPYYTKNIGGYDFFFLNSSIIDPSGGNHNIATLGEAQLAWLDEGLSKVDANTPAFIFHHQKFNQIADAEELKTILAKYPNAIFMTSHTHTDMNTEGVFAQANDTMCNTANTSAVSYTVYKHYNPNGEDVQERSQAYYVEVYEDRVLFRGMDIMTNEWIPSAQFVFWYGDVETHPADANLYPAVDGNYESFAFDASAVPAVGEDGFTVADTATVTALEGKFNFYYDREGAHYRERDLFDNLDTNDNYNPTGTTTGWSKWVPSGEWLTRTTGKTSGEMFRKIDSLVPLDSKGNEVLAENFETTFNVKFAGTKGGVILGFRQKDAGHFTEGYYSIVKTMGFVSIHQNGISIASGNDILSKNGGDATSDMYDHFETSFTTALPSTVTVKVRVVGADIAVEIYDYATQQLLYSEQDTLSYVGAGTLAYGVSATGHSIGDITLTKLNKIGAPLDLAAEGDFANGAVELVDVEKTDAGYRYTIEITPDAGYELQAGSLYVMDATGNYYVPTRVGFRAGGNATQYTVTINGEGAVFATFMQPTAETPNIGNLGTSINPSLVGLRFISRFTHVVENGTAYVVLGNEKFEIDDFGMLLGIDTVIGDNELSLEYANDNKYVQKLSVKQSGIYYDYCDDHIDMSVCITGVDKVKGGADMQVVSRSYVQLTNGTVLYGEALSSSYNETRGVYTTATMADLVQSDAVVWHGRTTLYGTARQLPAYGGTGLTVKGTLSGDVSLSVNHSEYACVLNVVINGDTENVKSIWLGAGDATVKVANDLPQGEYTIEITRGTSNYGVLTVKDITYNGTLGTPAENPLQFEFLGDSITAAGGGNVDLNGANDNLSKSKAHNTFFGYAAQTARAFGAGVSIVAKSGNTTAQTRKLFNDSKWDFANNQKDVVVINLGTNDFGYAGKPSPSDIEGFADTCKALIADVCAAYGEDTYIIWAYGMMFDKDKDFLAELIAAYRVENNDDRVLFCDLSAAKNNAGNGNHPDQQGHDDAAALLVAFIRENCADIVK